MLVFPPSLIGYYRGNFKFFGIKEFQDLDSWDAFLERHSDFEIDVIPNINFESRQLIVASSKGPHLIGLFEVIRRTSSAYRLVFRKILQNEDMLGTTAALLLTFPKNYKLSVAFKPACQLIALEKRITELRSRILLAESIGENAKELDEEEIMTKAEQLRASFLKEKTELEWTTIYRYCGFSLEEEDMFTYIPS